MTKKETAIIDIEGLMSELFTKLKDNNLSKKEHTEIVKKLKYLEQHYRNVQDKKTNGKKYPPVDKGYYTERSGLNDKEKKEVYNLISKVDTHNDNHDTCYTQGCYSTDGVYVQDPSGVAVGQKRFIEIDQDIDIRTHEK